MSLLLPTRPVPIGGASAAPTRSTGRPALRALTVVFSLVLVGLFLWHAAVPDIAGIGLLLDTAIPWFGLLLIPLVVMALVARRALAPLAVLGALLVWAALFGPGLVPLSWSATAASTADGTHLTVASQNIEASSGTGETS